MILRYSTRLSISFDVFICSKLIKEVGHLLLSSFAIDSCFG